VHSAIISHLCSPSSKPYEIPSTKGGWIQSPTNAELRQQEEVVYKKNVDAEKRCFMEERVARKAVQEKQDVQDEMTRIKNFVRALSTKFPELIVRPEDSAEVAVERVTALVHSLQGKVEELGAQLVSMTPP